MNYAVVFTYSFDDKVVVYLFEDERAAIKFLKESYDKELRIDIENKWNSEGYYREDGWYASITTSFDDGDEPYITEFRIANVYSQK